MISKLYPLHGIGFPSLLKGMFAIAIVDGSKLVLARDRFGIKPVYYYQDGKTVLVCSEIKGILKHPKVSPIFNMQSLEETAVFGYVHSQEDTFFRGIKQVAPGSVVSFDSSGDSTKKQFGNFPSARYLNGIPEFDYPDAVRETKRLLIQAVDRMFRHGAMDEGLYLSGGLDSSTIAYIACAELGYPLRTFTLADSPDTADFQAAGKVAKAFNTKHKSFIVSTDDYWRWIPDYVASMRV